MVNTRTNSSKVLTIILLLLIVAAAVFFRFAGLEHAPPGLYPDEAMNGINAAEALESGEYSVFYPENNGREGLSANIAALAFGLFGVSAEVLRGVTAVFGVLMVLGLFFLTRLLWGPRLALVASYLSAVGFWAVNFSRIGFRAMILPAVLVWSFYLLFRGLKYSSGWQIAAGGFVFGIGLHSYISFRIAPVLLVLLLIGLFIYNKKTSLFSGSRSQLLKYAGVFLVAVLITAAPLLAYWVQNPADFLGRANQVSVFTADSPIGAFIGATIKTLGMFSFVGDFNWRHNLSGRPLLGYAGGAAFLIGFLVLVWQSIKKRKMRDWFLLAWFIIMLTPNFFAPEGAPHALRALGALPAVYIITALGFVWVYEQVQGWLTRKKEQFKDQAQRLARIQKEVAVLALLVLVFFGVWEARAYFVRWAPNAHTQGAFTQRLADIGEFTKITNTEHVYMVVNEGGVLVDGIPVAAQSVRFTAWEERDKITFITPDEISTIPSPAQDLLIIPTLPDNTLLSQLGNQYPESTRLRTPTFSGIRVP